MRCKLIILFLFFRITVFCATAERIYYNDNVNTWTTSQRNQSDDTSFVLINPKQIQQAEATIKNFLIRLTGPIAQPTLISSFDGGNLQSTISEISKIIRTKLMEFARASGLTTSVQRQFKRTSWNSTISENWFTEGLVQGSLLLSDLVRIGEEVWFTIDRYFDRHNVTLYEDKELLSHKTMKSFKFLSIINDAATFNEKLFKCLLAVKDRKNLTFFYLDQTLVNLITGSLDSNVKTFRFNVEPKFSYTPNNGSEKLYALLCHSLVKRANHYDDCIKELRYLVACVSSPRQNSREMITHRTLFAKPWLTAIETLSDCKIYVNEDGSASVRCNFDQKLPRTTTRRVRYIYEKILNHRISKRSPLRHVANELGNVLSRSRWGRQFIYDVCQYFTIYEEGRRRLNTLSKYYTHNKDKKTVIRYNKISVSLDLYKSGILRKTMFAIDNVHRSALAMQKFFIQDIRNSRKQSWQTQILVCLSKWMKKLLELFGCTNLDDTDNDMQIPTDAPSINMTDSNSVMIDDDIYDENNEINHLMIYRKKDQIRKATDEAFDRLMHSINHINRVQNRNSKRTLTCLANNLLLATMFMETISFVSTLFCLGEHKDESNFEELEEE
ncbi:uncharacterized protein [Anoplolepis gracilipes]|uniref:uncharacterized protein n=1 Tax=Anoplolepis gracilipes TaxID=354296 RepID=UPI003BA0803C